MTASIVKSFMRIAALFFVAAAPAALARDCEMPDEGGAPLRRAVARVKYLPEIETWAELMSRSRTVVQYVLSLDEPRSIGGRCYWPVEVRADGRLWKRFLVTPDGARVVQDETP